MSVERTEVLERTRRLCRTLSSAPDPRRQADAIASALLKVHCWTPAEAADIRTFAVWLASAPSVDSLQPRARAVLRRLSGV